MSGSALPASAVSASAASAVSATPGVSEPASSLGLSAHTRRIALIVSGTFFIEQLDTTVIATAVPEIAHALGTDALQLNLAMTAYMLGLAIFVPISGRFADRFGSRKVFGFATALFIAASALCGASSSVEMLVAARFLQGIGGAMMAPVGRLIVLRTASRTELVEAMAWVLLPAMLAPMIGPAVGGLITTYASWRWIFFLNLPLGFIALYLIFRHVEKDPPTKKVDFDIRGTILVGTCFSAATVGLEMLTHHGNALIPALLLLASAVFFGGYIAHFRKHETPVLDLGLLRVPSFRWSMLGGSVYRIGVGGLPFLLPVALQVAYGMSPLNSGLVVLVPAIGGFAMKFFSTRILVKYGYRNSFIVNGLWSVLFLGAVALCKPDWPWWIVCSLLFLFGFSRSLHMNAYGTIAYADVSKERMASATSFFLSIQNLTVGLGVAFSALSVRVAQMWTGNDVPVASNFSFALIAMTAACVVSMFMAFKFDPHAGAELLARKTKS